MRSQKHLTRSVPGPPVDLATDCGATCVVGGGARFALEGGAGHVFRNVTEESDR